MSQYAHFTFTIHQMRQVALNAFVKSSHDVLNVTPYIHHSKTLDNALSDFAISALNNYGEARQIENSRNELLSSYRHKESTEFYATKLFQYIYPNYFNVEHDDDLLPNFIIDFMDGFYGSFVDSYGLFKNPWMEYYIQTEGNIILVVEKGDYRIRRYHEAVRNGEIAY